MRRTRRTGKALLVAAAVFSLRHAVTAHRKRQVLRDGERLGECFVCRGSAT